VKRAAMALSLIVLAGCISSGLFARVDVACGASALVYSNAQKMDEKITIEAADRCTGKDSEVQMVDAKGTVVQTFPIPDGTTKSIAITVPNDHWLNFVCNGSQGGCWYAITSH
jgi:hypothetical protein